MSTICCRCKLEIKKPPQKSFNRTCRRALAWCKYTVIVVLVVCLGGKSVANKRRVTAAGDIKIDGDGEDPIFPVAGGYCQRMQRAEEISRNY